MTSPVKAMKDFAMIEDGSVDNDDELLFNEPAFEPILPEEPPPPFSPLIGSASQIYNLPKLPSIDLNQPSISNLSWHSDFV